MNINQLNNMNSAYQLQSTRSVSRVEKVTSEDASKQQNISNEKGQDTVNISKEGRAALAASQSQAVLNPQKATANDLPTTSATAKVNEGNKEVSKEVSTLTDTGVSSLNTNSKEEVSSLNSNEKEDSKANAVANQYSRAANAYASNMKATAAMNAPMNLNSMNA